MKSAIIKLVSFVVILILSYGFYLYNTQEELLFSPDFLSKDYQFEIDTNFEEINIKTNDNESLNCLLFKSDSSKGLVLFFHGNSGSNADWTSEYNYYAGLGYDYMITDYRGFGKSTGAITSQEQVLNDALLVLDSISKRYNKESIIIVGYSFGCAIAAYVASQREVKTLVLLSPFYSLLEIKNQIYPLFPNFMLKYDLETYKYLDEVDEEILIFHGIDDRLISIESSMKLKKHLKDYDKYVQLRNQGHPGITKNPDYKARLKSELELGMIQFE